MAANRLLGKITPALIETFSELWFGMAAHQLSEADQETVRATALLAGEAARDAVVAWLRDRAGPLDVPMAGTGDAIARLGLYRELVAAATENDG